MIEIINNLYNLTLFLLGGSILFLFATLGYVIGIVRYYKKYKFFNEELVKIKIDDTIKKDNIY